MPRLATVDPTSDTGPGADLLNGPLKDKQINIFKGLATHPAVLKAYLGFAQGIKGGALTAAEHEIVALTVSVKRNCEYCQAAHTTIAKGVGLDEEASLAVRRGLGADERQEALIDFTRAIIDTDGFVSDAQLKAFRAAGFLDGDVIEVIAEIASTTFTNYFNHVHETEIDFPVPASV